MRTDAVPKNAPTAQVAIRLWPQPCPTPFNASYSARKAMVGPPSFPFASARKEVESPPYPFWTWKPCFSSTSLIKPAAFTSSNPSSGLSWMFFDSPARSAFAWSIASTICSFCFSIEIALRFYISLILFMLPHPISNSNMVSLLFPLNFILLFFRLSSHIFCNIRLSPLESIRKIRYTVINAGADAGAIADQKEKTYAVDNRKRALCRAGKIS